MAIRPLHEEEPVIWIEHIERDPTERDVMGLEFALMEFEDFTTRRHWLSRVKRLRIGEPSWKHVEREVVEKFSGRLDE